MPAMAIVQARMTSTRLPGKVLLPLGGETMLSRLIYRLRRAEACDAIVVATTDNSTDDPVAELCARLDVPCTRGSEHDVLGRYVAAAAQHDAERLVRVTADCPLLDPAIVDQLVEEHASSGCDYVSNMLPPTWPYGMAVEVFSHAALISAHECATKASDREHVTPYIYGHPERFELRNVRNPTDLSGHRWTVDTPADYELVSRLFDAVYPGNPNFTLADLLATIAQHPEWTQINQHIEQKSVDSAACSPLKDVDEL